MNFLLQSHQIQIFATLLSVSLKYIQCLLVYIGHFLTLVTQTEKQCEKDHFLLRECLLVYGPWTLFTVKMEDIRASPK